MAMISQSQQLQEAGEVGLNNDIQRNPVLLVHGIYDTVAKFERMSVYLTQLGWSVHGISLTPNNGAHRLENLAHQVADYVNETFPARQSIDLIGFSMGGLVTRYYLQRLGGIERVQRYISLSAPNNGTLTAYASSLPGIVQMRPQSDFLQDLNQDGVQMLKQVDMTVIWTPFDLMIIPATSSRLGVGKEIELPVWVHAWMVSDRRSLAAVATTLSR
jgi:triacylglycerol lipase